MDFSKVVEPVADYLNFLINYWVHGKFPTEPIPALGEVNTYVLVLFLLGMFFNFLVIQFRPFDFDPDAPTDKSTFKKIESHAVMSSVPLVVVSALMFEFMLWVFGTRSQPQNAEMGNFADTINGHLLMSAAMAAIFAFLPLFGDQHKRLKAKGRQVIALDLIIIRLSLCGILLFYFAFPLLSFALNVESSVIRWPYISSIILALVIGFFFGMLKETAKIEKPETPEPDPK